jgi:threonine/homoserine efflux transporter RhtA
MFGVLGSVISGTAGAVLTLRIAPRLGGLALVELMLALAAVVLISVCSRVRGQDSQEAEHQNDP